MNDCAHGPALPRSPLAGNGSDLAAASENDTAESPEPTNTQVTALAAAIGVSERTVQRGSCPRRIGCSIRMQERTLTVSANAIRNSTSGVPLSPVELLVEPLEQREVPKIQTVGDIRRDAATAASRTAARRVSAGA